jgi:hypothetical protein
MDATQTAAAGDAAGILTRPGREIPRPGREQIVSKPSYLSWIGDSPVFSLTTG